jgi:hypothetical protein
MSTETTGLEDRDRSLLQAIGELGGTPSGQAALIAWGFSDRRAKAQEAVRRFRALEARGLVRRLDDLKPICWVRMPAGTEALQNVAA